ncbi:MAG: sigma 54-interacting transcriptional regulator [Planctomycetes bacterium]|nr:sigma 54-interacting transcriptional regulator [Planctomycetota bacterium]
MDQQRKQERIASIIFDSISEGVFTTDRECRITSFNRAAERISGFTAEEAIGRYCFDVFRTELCNRRCALRTTLSNGAEVQNIRVTIITHDGRRVPINVSTSILHDEEGEVMGAVEFFRDLTEVEDLERRLERAAPAGNLVSANEEMQRIARLLPDVAESECSVLIQGPSGSGKELIAQALHNLSPRRKGPFVKLNCGALPPNLLESELFGYEPGAFTDAKRTKPGQFQMAHGGTLLLDEIGEMPLATQVKLFRVLSTGEFSPLGSVKVHRVDARIIACTNRDLEEMIERGEFREELYYRVNVVNIRLPALKDRPEDLNLLAEHFVQRFRERRGKGILGLSSATLEVLRRYDFPGNVRELENAIEHSFVMCRGDTIEPEHLPRKMREATQSRPKPLLSEQSEKAVIREALARNGGDRQKTARELGVHRSTLWRKVREYGL